MPKARIHSSHAIRSPQSGQEPLAIRAMGNKHSCPLARCRHSEKILACSQRLLQQMGKGRSLCQHQRQRHFQVCLEKYRLSIWNPTSNCG